MRIRTRLSGLDMAILDQLKDGPFMGVGCMAERVNCTDGNYVRKRIERLRRSGLVVIRVKRRPGRGCKMLIERKAVPA